MLRRDVQGVVRDRMRPANGFRAACLVLGLALLGVACDGPPPDAERDGVRGGTLRVLSAEDVDGLDTAVVYTPNSMAIARAYARTLYGYDLSRPRDQVTVPVPDIAAGPPQVSADRRTYTFTLRPGVHYAQPVNREVTATDFITAIERFYGDTPSPGQQYADLIAGAREFDAGKASGISGLAAPDPRTLRITLDRPAEDLRSILSQQLFAPVPKEHAASYQVGADYDTQVVGSGPYTLATYIPNETILLVRNRNWDPATDPLRRAWVDRIQITFGVTAPAIQRAIRREEADLSLHSHVPASELPELRADPELARRLSVNPSECQYFLILGTHPKAGAIADVRVRRAVNYAVDKVAYRDAVAGQSTAPGELASTIQAPGAFGYRQYDLYSTPGGQGDPARAKALLAQAGYPDGLTLRFVSSSSGTLAAGNKAIVSSLQRAGIRLKTKTFEGHALYEDSLFHPEKRLEHQLALSGWCPDFPGDNARGTIVSQYDGRIPHDVSGNFSEYHNRDVNRMIDQALAEPDQARRAARWGEIDQRIMGDAPMVPLTWHTNSYLWSSRLRGWVYDPTLAGPDLTAPWLDPQAP